MICNCTNNGKNNLVEYKIPHVQGNVLRIAIPLTLRTIEVVDGEVEATDTDFIPSSEHPVNVIFSKGAVSYRFDAEMRDGNKAFVEDKGKMPVGQYDITVTCMDDNGNPYRFNQPYVLNIVKSTAEAGITSPIEYEVQTWYLDAAIFLTLKGEDGVGIADIRTESSSDIGGMNTVTIVLTNGQTRSFTVMNGSGSVDQMLDPTSPHPIANKAVAARFTQVDESIAGLFGYANYDSQSRTIRFWDKDRENILATIDARPFIKDGMVNSVYISNNTLVITFNTDSGREAIGVPLSSVFNPNNYYTKTQIDNRISSLLTAYYTKSEINNLLANINVDGYAELDSTDRLKYGQASAIVLDAIELDTPVGVGGNMIYGSGNGHIIKVTSDDVDTEEIDLGIAPQLVFLNKDDNNFYRWTGGAWQQVGGSSGGYDVAYSNGVLSFNGSNQPTYNNGILTI